MNTTHTAPVPVVVVYTKLVMYTYFHIFSKVLHESLRLTHCSSTTVLPWQSEHSNQAWKLVAKHIYGADCSSHVQSDKHIPCSTD